MKRLLENYLKWKYGDGDIDYSYPSEWGNKMRWFYDNQLYSSADLRFVTILGVTLLVRYEINR